MPNCVLSLHLEDKGHTAGDDSADNTGVDEVSSGSVLRAGWGASGGTVGAVTAASGVVAAGAVGSVGSRDGGDESSEDDSSLELHFWLVVVFVSNRTRIC